MKFSSFHFYLWMTLVLVFPVKGYTQTITNPAAITLPQAPAISHIVASGQILTVTSGTSITLKPGTHFQQGSNVLLRVDLLGSIPAPPSAPNANNELNWTISKSFAASGTVIAESKVFFDFSGNPTQQQFRNISAGHVLATQIIYDLAGRPVISTLPAPTNNAAFAYKSNFVLNATNTAYGYRNFDKYTNGSTVTDKTHAPDAIGGKTTVGTLGWYYSNNGWESMQAVTDYPYTRQLFSTDGTGRAIKAGGVGDEYRVGKNHEPAAYSTAVGGALAHYLAVRNKFFPATEVGERPASLEKKAIISVTKDENGTEAISVNTIDGQTLLTALSGSEYGISNTAQLINGASGGLPADSGLYYFNLPLAATVTITGGAWQLYNMSDKEQLITFTSGQSLPKGYYRLHATTTTAVNLSYSYGIGTISYSFYNQLGQLVASITPEGVKKLLGTGLNNYTAKTAIPFTELYEYDTQGRLVKIQNFETGVSEFVYRKDGNIRFSQNAVQKTDSRFSYTNYDPVGRPVESGEYKPGTGGITFGTAGMTNILEDMTVNGGLANGTKYDMVRTKYDVIDNSHNLSGYIQDAYFMRGAVSTTEKYSSVVNNAPAAANLVSRTWYSYDGLGQVNWVVSQLNGLGYKTTDYTYDELGNVIKTVYQKSTAAECFVHYYEYDADKRLAVVYTNTVDNVASRSLQAKYYYYLHGPLKRVELADKLQGIDYTYTADGKLKAINHANVASDPGKDGTGNSFSQDVFGMNVEYHANDYARSNSGIGSIQNASYPPNYNGNINGISWSSKKPSSVTGQDGMVMNTYKYDAKYQLTNNGWGTPNFSTNAYTETANANKEHGITYDGNGNILTLKRNNSAGTATANYTYAYTANTNKLASVSGYATYTYDAIGRLASETKGSESSYLEYDVTGKVTKIYNDAAKTQLKFSFVYDESGKRIKKQDHTNNNITWYVYDGSGQLAAVYDNGDGTMRLREQPVYAGSRVGIYFRQANNYQYQLSDHLGNVRVVVNRNKLSNGNADVVFYADYYPFGTVVRSGGTGWRYGYQGEYSEKDGETGWNSFAARNYDTNIGRWLSTDPYFQYASAYKGMGNNPVLYVDKDGNFAVVGAIVGGVVGGGISAVTQYLENGEVSWARVGASAATGALAGSGVGLVGAAAISLVGDVADQLLEHDGDFSKINRGQVVSSTLVGGVFGGTMSKHISARLPHSSVYKALEGNTLKAAKWTKRSLSSVAGRNLMHGNRLNSLTKKLTLDFSSESSSGIMTYLMQKGASSSFDYLKETGKASWDAAGFLNNFFQQRMWGGPWIGDKRRIEVGPIYRLK